MRIALIISLAFCWSLLSGQNRGNVGQPGITTVVGSTDTLAIAVFETQLADEVSTPSYQVVQRNTWVKRWINTTIIDQIGIQIVGDSIFRIPPGNYYIEASATINVGVGERAKHRIFNGTTSIGSSLSSKNPDDVPNQVQWSSGLLASTDTTDISLDIYAYKSTGTTLGVLGNADQIVDGLPERYANLTITKIEGDGSVVAKDGLGKTFEAQKLVVGTGTSEGTTYPELLYNPGTEKLEIGSSVMTGETGDNDGFGTLTRNLITLGESRAVSGASTLDFHSTAGAGSNASIERQSGANGTLNFENKGGGSHLFTNNLITNFEIIKTGQLTVPQYGAGAFDSSPFRALGIDASNKVITYSPIEKAGSPATDQIAVWASDGSIEGDPKFRFYTTDFEVGDGTGQTKINVATGSITTFSVAGSTNTVQSSGGNAIWQTTAFDTLKNIISFSHDSIVHVAPYNDTYELGQRGNVNFSLYSTNRASNIFSVDTAGVTEFSFDIEVPAEVYGVGWDDSNEVPTKNDVYDKIETISGDGLGSSPSTGAILFGLGTTTAGIDATNLFWDNSDKELSIGHASAGAVLDVRSSADVTKSTGFFGANQTSTAFNTTYPGLYVANTSATTDSYARINFGDGDAATSAAMGVQLINPAANYGNYEFWTRGTEGLTQKMLITSNGNIGFNATTFGTSADNVIGIGNGVEPTTNPADMVQITAYDVASSSELFVENEGGEKSMLTSSYIDLSKDVSQNVGGAAGTVTYISWDDDAVPHKDANFTHEDATNPTRIQVATTGRYRLNWMIGCDNTGADRFVIKSHYRVNGTTVVTKGRQSNYSRGAALGNEIYVGMNIEINLTAGDYIECGVEVEHTTATYTVNTIQADSYFQMRQL